MPYNTVKTLLWLALGGAFGYAGLAGHSVVSLLLIAGTAALLAVWLARHPTEIQQTYVARVARGQQYIRESRKPWKQSPKPYVPIAILLVVGLGCLYATFPSPSPNIHGYLRQLAYSFLGPQGTVVAAGFGAAYFLCTAVEDALGAHWSREA